MDGCAVQGRCVVNSEVNVHRVPVNPHSLFFIDTPCGVLGSGAGCRLVSYITEEELKKRLLQTALQQSFLLMWFHFYPYRPSWYFELPWVMYSLGLVS